MIFSSSNNTDDNHDDGDDDDDVMDIYCLFMKYSSNTSYYNRLSTMIISNAHTNTTTACWQAIYNYVIIIITI